MASALNVQRIFNGKQNSKVQINTEIDIARLENFTLRVDQLTENYLRK